MAINNDNNNNNICIINSRTSPKSPTPPQKLSFTPHELMDGILIQRELEEIVDFEYVRKGLEENTIVLIDVRPTESLIRDGVIPGALNIPSKF